jgi:ADP-heptose:LPS heptosyltransferase
VKVLVVRFSSIGDIVLTTPVIRALKMQLPQCEIHYLTKEAFIDLLKTNEHLDKIFTIKKSIQEVTNELRLERYDCIIDLHNNLRSLILARKLGVKRSPFPKLNIRKWLLVRFKLKLMPHLHIVDRYFKAVEFLGVKNDQLPCEISIPTDCEVNTTEHFGMHPKGFIAIAIGAQFATKRLPFSKLKEIIEKLDFPVLLVGGPTDMPLAQELLDTFPNKQLKSACGQFNLLSSASIVRQSAALVTNDTGLMHIASCYNVPTVSVWGNTVPSFGMYPYFPQQKEKFSIHQIEELSCRPCSKIGFRECPKGHFNCMNLQNSTAIAEDAVNKAGLFAHE